MRSSFRLSMYSENAFLPHAAPRPAPRGAGVTGGMEQSTLRKPGPLQARLREHLGACAAMRLTDLAAVVGAPPEEVEDELVSLIEGGEVEAIRPVTELAADGACDRTTPKFYRLIRASDDRFEPERGGPAPLDPARLFDAWQMEARSIA